jgi:hypothetical protein
MAPKLKDYNADWGETPKKQAENTILGEKSSKFGIHIPWPVITFSVLGDLRDETAKKLGDFRPFWRIFPELPI